MDDFAAETDPRAPIPQRYVVRYSQLRHLGEFSAKPGMPFRRGDQVIVRTHRGVEWGEVLAEATDRTRELMGATVDDKGRLLRLANAEDLQERDKQQRLEREYFETANEVVREFKLQMQLIDGELILAGDRIVFYYVSEQRIDFREMVKVLANRLKVRVEMRQIGIRDEAKLLADYGDCGKPVCCNTHLAEMPPVSMKMAKLQKASLDPNKISGRCGRLKCCLRYEYDTYEEYRRELPPVGAMVVTRQGQGKVIAQEILAKKLLVSYEGQRQIITDLKDILTVVSSKGSSPKTEQAS